MNIFLRELKANLSSLLIWGVIVGLFVVVGTAKFSAYYGNPDMLAILDAMPAAMLDAFNLRAFNLTTLNGFFGVMFTYYALLLGIAAAMWGSDIISKEERDKTVEFSLTLPVTRGRVVTAKTLAAVVNCLALLLITWGASVASAQPYSPDSAFYSFLGLEMQLVVHPATGLSGHRHLPGLRHDALQARRFDRRLRVTGDLLHVHYLQHEQEPGFPEIPLPLQVFRRRRLVSGRNDECDLCGAGIRHHHCQHGGRLFHLHQERSVHLAPR